MASFMFLGVQDVMAQEAAATGGSGISMAVGLALIVAIFRSKQSIDIDTLNSLKG